MNKTPARRRGRRRSEGPGPAVASGSRQGDAYTGLVGDIAALLETARRTAARAINALMTATYWEVGRRIVEFEQKGKRRAEYGEALLKRLATDLTRRHGRGFGWRNLFQMRAFYLAYPAETLQTSSAMLAGSITASPLAPEVGGILQTPSAGSGEGKMLPASSDEATLHRVAARFPLPWSAYVRLFSVKNNHARRFYETEALRDGWSVRQLDRQINSQFYERTALSRNKAAMLRKGARAEPGEVPAAEEEIKDPYVLEFLDLKDEYSETDLEAALIGRLETFLLELGGDFCFVGRQKRLRVGDAWYRVDLLFFHRRLRCLVVIDLKLGRFTHADAGQMHLYLNYAQAHWTRPGENPPVGLILCAQKNEALARYALDNLPNKVMAAEYRTALPDEHLIAEELSRTRRALESRRALATRGPKGR